MTLTDFINSLYGAECGEGELAQLAKLHTIAFAQKISQVVQNQVADTSRVSVSLAWLDKRPYASPVNGFPVSVLNSGAGKDAGSQTRSKKVELADAGIFIFEQVRHGFSPSIGSAILLQAKVSKVAEWDDNFFKLYSNAPTFKMVEESRTRRAIVDKPMDVSSRKEWFLLTKRPAFYLLPGPNSTVDSGKSAFFSNGGECTSSEYLAARFMFANRGKSFSLIGPSGCHWVTADPADYLTFDVGLGDLIEQMARALIDSTESPGKSFNLAECNCGDGECQGATGAIEDWSRLCNCILKLAGERETPKRYFSNKQPSRVVSSISFIRGGELSTRSEPVDGELNPGFLAIVIRILRDEA